MKNIRIFILSFFLLTYLVAVANPPKREFRSTWLTTASSIDWPKYKAKTETGRKAQQLELTYIFDELVKGNMNAACFQVRGRSDAFYKSSYEPWSQDLTGTRGQDPGYDPLAYAIEEAHKRGLELHVWVNPFRVTSTGSLSTADKVYQNCNQWILKYNNGSFDGQFFDPGYPEAREYIKKVLMEIVNNYDIDGIIMDDYFYPYGGTTTEDAASKALYKPSNMSDGDWRRSNVDKFVKDMYDAIQASKPWVRFGIAPFGIWTTNSSVANKYGIALPSNINGMDAYSRIYCNPVEWVKNGYVDYIAPQIYWSTTATYQDYDVLSKWWSHNVCKYYSNSLPNGKRVESFVAHSASEFGAAELEKQIQDNRDFNLLGGPGSIFFSTIDYTGVKSKPNTKHTTIKNSKFTSLALPPAMDWKSKTSLAAPSNLKLSGTTISWNHSSASRFTVYAYPKGTSLKTAMANSAYLKGVVYGKSFDASSIANISSMTIAVCAYDRYGVEHTAALYNEGTSSGGDDDNEITWVLNGGKVNSVAVPSQEELWSSFKNDAGLSSTLGTLAEIKNPSDLVASCKTICTKLTSDYVTTIFDNSSWTWLHNYIMSTQNAQVGNSVASSTVPELTSDLTTPAWRYAIAAFFLQTQYTSWPYSADFTTAGQPAAWGSAYQTANGGGSLPTSVTSTFVLPTPTHPEGCTFMGWYDNASFSGSAITSIPAGWTGTLYAKWHCGDVDIIWELNGGYVEGADVSVPSQEELWSSFQTTAGISLGTLNEINSNEKPINAICGVVTEAIVINTFSNSKWTWLKTYIQGVQASQVGQSYTSADGTTRTIAELPNNIADGSVYWRYSTASFFLASQYLLGYPITADFSIAGQPSAWGPAYQSANEGTSLPSSVTSTYTLPIPKHPKGYEFLGWYDNPSFSGSPLTTIPAGWVGTLYARWKTPTSIENIFLYDQPMQVFDLLGHYVGNNIENLNSGSYIIILGQEVFKVVL